MEMILQFPYVLRRTVLKHSYDRFVPQGKPFKCNFLRILSRVEVLSKNIVRLAVNRGEKKVFSPQSAPGRMSSLKSANFIVRMGGNLSMRW